MISISLIWLTSCAPSGSQIQAAIRQTQAGRTPVPTQTALPPTRTALPPIEVTPTSTPLPLNTPLAPDLPVVKRVIYQDSFDTLSSKYWLASGDAGVINGHINIQVPGNLTYNPDYVEGHGYLVLFRTQPLTTFILGADYGPWGDPGYRGMLFINASLYALYTGSSVNQKGINFKYKPGILYYALLWLDQDSAKGKIWEKDHPENSRSFSVDRNGFTLNHALNFNVNILNKGSIDIYEFQELEFQK